MLFYVPIVCLLVVVVFCDKDATLILRKQAIQDHHPPAFNRFISIMLMCIHEVIPVIRKDTALNRTSAALATSVTVV